MKPSLRLLAISTAILAAVSTPAHSEELSPIATVIETEEDITLCTNYIENDDEISVLSDMHLCQRRHADNPNASIEQDIMTSLEYLDYLVEEIQAGSRICTSPEMPVGEVFCHNYD